MIEKREVELTDEVMTERLKKYGKTSSTWYCSAKCGNEIISFIYSYEYHVPEMCSKCNSGWMFEDESKRIYPQKMFIGGGKQAEDNWFNSQSVAKQAAILADNNSDNFY